MNRWQSGHALDVNDEGHVLKAQEMTFPQALTALHDGKYTGAVTLHFAEGQPKVLELPHPVTVKLV